MPYSPFLPMNSPFLGLSQHQRLTHEAVTDLSAHCPLSPVACPDRQSRQSNLCPVMVKRSQAVGSDCSKLRKLLSSLPPPGLLPPLPPGDAIFTFLADEFSFPWLVTASAAHCQRTAHLAQLPARTVRVVRVIFALSWSKGPKQ